MPVHPLSLYLTSRTKLDCTLQLGAQIHSTYFSSTPICALWVGCPRNKNFGWNRNKICFGCVSVCFVKTKTKKLGLFWYFEPLSKQPKQRGLFRNKPKLSFKLFGLVLCWFRFTQNIETLCFSIEAKQPNQTEKIEKTKKN
jgi:hypothetical protein